MTTVLSRQDWDFDAVPATELAACCYWEYARESAFVRDVRQRCLDPARRQMTNSQYWDHCGADFERIQSIGCASEVFLRGFFFAPEVVYQSVDENAPRYRHPEAPPITGSFPKPWLSLSDLERTYRARIRTEREAIPLLAFKRGHAVEAKDIVEWVMDRRRELDAQHERVRRANPGRTDEALCGEGKLRFPEIPPSVFWVGGRELTVVAIEWGRFTNEEIIQTFRRWVKANRPRQYPVPSRQGHKPGDWRANLTRLAVMRLLARHTPLELVAGNKFPAIWSTKQFSARKWGDITKWYDARREAGKCYHRLFPFLPSDQRPLSWDRREPGK